ILEPLLVLLYDRAFFAPSYGEALRRSRGLYAGLFASWALGALYVLVHLAREGWNDVGAGGRTPVSYLAAQLFVIPFYVERALVPWTLCIDHGWPSVPGWQVAVGGVATLGLAAATVLAWRRSRPLGFLGAWFFLNLLPVSSVIPRVDLAVEHRMYVPLAAVILAVLVLGARLPRKARL